MGKKKKTKKQKNKKKKKRKSLFCFVSGENLIAVIDSIKTSGSCFLFSQATTHQPFDHHLYPPTPSTPPSFSRVGLNRSDYYLTGHPTCKIAIRPPQDEMLSGGLDLLGRVQSLLREGVYHLASRSLLGYNNSGLGCSRAQVSLGAPSEHWFFCV